MDFYVLDMEDEDAANPIPLLLGCPLMKTARAKIDVFNGTLTMELDGEVVHFNIFEAMRYPSDVHSYFSIDVLDVLAQQVLDLGSEDALDVVIRNNLEHIPQPTTIKIDEHLKEIVASLETLSRLPPR